MKKTEESETPTTTDRIKDIAYDDNGELIVTYNEPEETDADDDEGEAESESTSDDDSTSDDADADADIDWEKRYNDLQPEFTRKSQELADMKRQAEQGAKDRAKEPSARPNTDTSSSGDSDEWDPSEVFHTRESADEWMKSNLQHPFEVLVTELAPMLAWFNEQQDVATARSEHDDLEAYSDEIDALRKADPNLTLPAAYKLAKAVNPNKVASQKKEAPAPKPKPKKADTSAEDKAKSLLAADAKPANSGGSEGITTENKPKGRRPRGTALLEAFNDAVEEVAS